MKQLLITFLNRIKRQVNAYKNSDKPEPIYPKIDNMGKLKIHFGSGQINLQGWINVDARAFDHVHIVSDDIKLGVFNDKSIDEVYLCHVLEHISFDDTQIFLKSLIEKLKPGGIVRISVPSFDSIIKIYENNNHDLEVVKFALMGGQDYEYNFHKSIYNFKSIALLLEKAGFSDVKEWTTIEDFGLSIGDWSDRNFNTKVGPVPISLNVKGTRL